MGIYLNPGNRMFQKTVSKKIYVDKSMLIAKLWEETRENNPYICISRPRRFGKSTDADMLAAFFSADCDSRELFDHLKISKWQDYNEHLNRHTVIKLNIQEFVSSARNIAGMTGLLQERVLKDIYRSYPSYSGEHDLCMVLKELCTFENVTFIFIIDEWDCIFREFKEDVAAQKEYLDFLRLLLKDQPYVEMAYMTGILPIKKYGTHSALNMFEEISMIDAGDYSAFMGFTDQEVQNLCRKYQVDYEQMKYWYDGYHMQDGISTYSPRSVTASIVKGDFANYWSQTETYEALKAYIDLNYDGLKDTIIELLAGEMADISVLSFQNDMTTFHSKDDVLSLLIHLGYLGFIGVKEEPGYGKVYIPNNEVKDTFITSVKSSDWSYVTEVFKNSRDLLTATWAMDADRVADYIEKSHYETSMLQYNDENALSYTVSLAYITARQYYTIIRELPAGKGFADLVFIPKGDKPAMLIELKYDKNADAGICQIKEKRYYPGLEKYLDNLLMIAVDYDVKTKKHQCIIEKYRRD